MTVREDMYKRMEQYDYEGNYFMADLIRDAFQHMSDELLDKEIEEDKTKGEMK